MTAAMPQPEKMTAADIEDIAHFLVSEARDYRLSTGLINATMLDAAEQLMKKAQRMRAS